LRSRKENFDHQIWSQNTENSDVIDRCPFEKHFSTSEFEDSLFRTLICGLKIRRENSRSLDLIWTICDRKCVLSTTNRSTYSQIRSIHFVSYFSKIFTHLAFRLKYGFFSHAYFNLTFRQNNYHRRN
jgi:hypothetical protein